jgi:hypothetical protein
MALQLRTFRFSLFRVYRTLFRVGLKAAIECSF